jgi:hypothetical protein
MWAAALQKGKRVWIYKNCHGPVLFFVLKLNIHNPLNSLFVIKGNILYFLPSEEHILMFRVSLSLSLCPPLSLSHTHTHTLSLLLYNEADAVPSTCTLQCEVSTIKLNIWIMIHHLSRERFVTVKWLLSSRPQWPHHVSFCGLSLLHLWGHELQSLSGQDSCTDEVTHDSWTRVCSRLSSNSLSPKIFFLRPAHKMKSTVPQCIINFVLIFFPDWVVAKPAAVIREGEVYNRVHTEA